MEQPIQTTLKIPRDIHKKAKIYAINENKSLGKLYAEIIINAIQEKDTMKHEDKKIKMDLLKESR